MHVRTCIAFVAGALAGGCVDAVDLESEMLDVVGDNTTHDDVRLTSYTLVKESETSGQNTGDSSTICNALGISGCFKREFLCSGYGVAMQGTGVANDGRYIKYVSGGGGWNANYTWLNNCATARFTLTDGVYGASGRQLTEYYSIAVDPNVIPLGWYVWIDAEGHWFRADDTGGEIRNFHIDIYRGLSSTGPAAAYSRIFVTSTAHGQWDPSPYGGGGGGGCQYACGDYGYAEGQCHEGWACSGGCLEYVGSCPASGYLLVNLHSRRCMETYGFSTQAGADVVQWGCHGGANQRWSLEWMSGGGYQIRNVHSGMCLDVFGPSTADGAEIGQWPCHGGTNQRFDFLEASGGYLLRAWHSNKCADVWGASTADGGDVVQWSCHFGANQVFYLQ